MSEHDCHHAHPHAHAAWLPRLDAFGSAASFVCAVHCAFLPLLAAVMPLGLVHTVGSHALEIGFVVFAAVFGLSVLGSGLSRAVRVPVALLYANALLFLSLGLIAHEAVVGHAVLMVIGGLSLGGAHALNRHSVRSRDDAQSVWKRLRAASSPQMASGVAVD